MQTFIEQIKSAAASQQSLSICGAQSKHQGKSELLSLQSYQGVVRYQPDELVITVKAGTSLRELNQILAEKNQMLAFEPPDYGDSTLGGTYACALTGSSQPFRGLLRDYVLGVKIINGLGEILSFGGELMKNVAGYDVSRLLVGSRGQLAVIAEISLKVLPLTDEKTYVIPLPEHEAIRLMNQWAGGTTLPLSACAYYQQQFFYRLSGRHSTQAHSLTDGTVWKTLNPFKPPLMSTQNLWRVSVESTQPTLNHTLAIDWCGRRRWIVENEQPVYHHEAKISLWQGQASLTQYESTTAINRIQQGLKQVFDPKGVFC